ncbi:Aste57867_14775 [Aphanomyces stellatus]|uniref:Aste57867_14775 protein n=1 Tax=Aphanomyces stellatus TaxID=120398 RepID=A0A485L2I5_9STRA|nr:hypothetical protein As57867_014720 [Aphanomyces stellatus]VFT91593.1 Aste57867_14775 [Aphanomyces stellatus]
MASNCHGCHAPLGVLFNRGKVCLCSHLFCATCINYALYVNDDDPTSTSLCKACFKSHWGLDMATSIDVFGPAVDAGAGPAVVFVHGGGSSRGMWVPHAEALAALNIRSVLIDLPGHGSRMDEPLTLAASFDAILAAADVAGTWKGEKPIYVGGSLGGYIGMEFLGQYPETFSRAVIAMCGQDVGVHRGWAAGIGLVFLGWVVSSFSAAGILKLMLDQVAVNGHLDSKIVASIKRQGFFFGQGAAQIAILKATDPIRALPRFPHPLLFVNGAKDHRDSETKWLAASTSSRLVVYDGADHFFSHDRRFMQRFLDDLVAFVQPNQLE